ncbi:PREDICTED: C-factor-like, partial [Rhagoletis zephyria]|uniref:C-factor-like n=1 Tax=Rhagoletis zephyria TaxID=28612 RepID=UPI000811980D
MTIFRNVMVTGANQGIGWQLMKDLLPISGRVIATVRTSNAELEAMKGKVENLFVVQYDATAYDSYDQVVEKVASITAGEGLDLLINNAGIYIRDSLEKVNPKDMLTNIEVNAVAPLVLTKALLPQLKASASSGQKTIVANISSQMGSIDDNKSGGSYAYRSSKAAQNMISKSLSVDLAPSKIIILALHPGWLQMDMGT